MVVLGCINSLVVVVSDMVSGQMMLCDVVVFVVIVEVQEVV